MANSDTRFTALGMSGSGKTCYVLGMYYEMCVGVRGFTVVTQNEMATKLERWMDKLDDNVGQDRFPAGTGLTVVEDYGFKLSYRNQPIMSFDWVDYGGEALRAREENLEAFSELEQSIRDSTALYIFIDGKHLCGDSYEEKLRRVKRKCARTINPYITEFVQANEGKLPPVVFVITKADLCGGDTNNEEIKKILEESFSSVFGHGTLAYIVCVSLGAEIADDNYSGEVEPVNIQTPFFIGIYHEFLNFCLYLKNKIQENENTSRQLIAESQSEINYQNSRWFFTDYESINRSRERIARANSDIADNRELLKKYRMLLNSVVMELAKQSSHFLVIRDGCEVDFEPDSNVYEI